MPAIPGRDIKISDRTPHYIFAVARLIVVPLLHYFIIFHWGDILFHAFGSYAAKAKWFDFTNLLFVIFVMHFITALRQTNWGLNAIGISAFNFVVESLTGSLPALFREDQSMSILQWVGFALFLFGGFIESSYEIGRLQFKLDSKNAGKPYTGGWAKIVQHPNYFGYTIFRGAYALVTKNWWVTPVIPFLISDFITGGIPDLQKHNSEKYGKLFRDYSAKTKKLIPFVY